MTIRTVSAVSLLAIVLTACATPPGSPMLWAIDAAGFIRPRDQFIETNYLTEADVVTISVSTAYLRYVNRDDLFDRWGSVQVLFYAEVFDSPESNEPYRSVLFNAETNEDVILPSVDRVIYGPVRFKGHPIRIRLFAIELDKEDNEKAAQILQSVGSVISAAQPAAAPVVGIGLAVGDVLLSLNEDDFELQADLTFHPMSAPTAGEAGILTAAAIGIAKDLRTEDRTTKFPQVRNELNTALRSGHYLLVKAEDAGRRGVFEESSQREYLAATSFDYGDERPCTVLIYKGGYLWLDDYDKTCADLNDTRFYDEKSYVSIAIRSGGPAADEAKMRAVALEQFKQVQGQLQGSNHERTIASINFLGQRTAALMRAEAVVDSQNQRVARDSSYRQSPNFIAGFVSQLVGTRELDALMARGLDDTYARDLNESLLRAIESSVVGFPLSSLINAGDWAAIDPVKEKVKDPASAVGFDAARKTFIWKK